jgi:MYXO-CTERM domain-containing protein
VRRALLAGATAFVVIAAAPRASANGRFPCSNEIVFSSSNDDLVVLRATFGFLPSYDYGTTWSWLCEDALGLPPTSNEDPSLALSPNDSLIAGVSLGLLVSPDKGCTWNRQGGPLQGQHIEDLDTHAAAPAAVLAITSTYEPDAGAEGGPGYVQHIFTSPDDGATWSIAGTIDPSAIVTSVAVAPTDAQRIYVSAYRGDGATRTASIFTSLTGGSTWDPEQPIPLDPTMETAAYVAAIDPQNEDLVYIRSEAALEGAPSCASSVAVGSSRLFVSSDGVQTPPHPVFSLPEDEMLGFALSPDGSKVYLGGPRTGLYVASSADLQFANVPQVEPDGGTRTIHVLCLATHGADLWACSDEPSGFVAGVSQDDGVTFTPRLHLLGIQGAVSCPAGTTSSMCTETDLDAETPYDPFTSLCTTTLQVCDNLTPPQALATACEESGACEPAMSGDAGAATTAASGGCSIVGGGGAAGALVALGVLGLAVRRRRRR